MEKDYYQILGLQKGASKDEVKKAFRKKAAEHHPDKKTGNEEKYKEVTEAYSVLGDEKKKAEYDTYGQSFNGAGGGGGNPFGGGGLADSSKVEWTLISTISFLNLDSVGEVASSNSVAETSRLTSTSSLKKRCLV
jgi:DnaJ-class molecular chaperone